MRNGLAGLFGLAFAGKNQRNLNKVIALINARRKAAQARLAAAKRRNNNGRNKNRR
jgi:hypothetical protein